MSSGTLAEGARSAPSCSGPQASRMVPTVRALAAGAARSRAAACTSSRDASRTASDCALAARLLPPPPPPPSTSPREWSAPWSAQCAASAPPQPPLTAAVRACTSHSVAASATSGGGRSPCRVPSSRWSTRWSSEAAMAPSSAARTSRGASRIDVTIAQMHASGGPSALLICPFMASATAGGSAGWPPRSGRLGSGMTPTPPIALTAAINTADGGGETGTGGSGGARSGATIDSIISRSAACCDAPRKLPRYSEALSPRGGMSSADVTAAKSVGQQLWGMLAATAWAPTLPPPRLASRCKPPARCTATGHRRDAISRRSEAAGRHTTPPPAPRESSAVVRPSNAVTPRARACSMASSSEGARTASAAPVLPTGSPSAAPSTAHSSDKG